VQFYFTRVAESLNILKRLINIHLFTTLPSLLFYYLSDFSYISLFRQVAANK